MPDLLPPLRPIPIKERLSILYVECGQVDVPDGALVVVDKIPKNPRCWLRNELRHQFTS